MARYDIEELARLIAGGHGWPAGGVPWSVRERVVRRAAELGQNTLLQEQLAAAAKSIYGMGERYRLLQGAREQNAEYWAGWEARRAAKKSLPSGPSAQVVKGSSLWDADRMWEHWFKTKNVSHSLTDRGGYPVDVVHNLADSGFDFESLARLMGSGWEESTGAARPVYFGVLSSALETMSKNVHNAEVLAKIGTNEVSSDVRSALADVYEFAHQRPRASQAAKRVEDITRDIQDLQVRRYTESLSRHELNDLNRRIRGLTRRRNDARRSLDAQIGNDAYRESIISRLRGGYNALDEGKVEGFNQFPEQMDIYLREVDRTSRLYGEALGRTDIYQPSEATHRIAELEARERAIKGRFTVQDRMLQNIASGAEGATTIPLRGPLTGIESTATLVDYTEDVWDFPTLRPEQVDDALWWKRSGRYVYRQGEFGPGIPMNARRGIALRPISPFAGEDALQHSLTDIERRPYNRIKALSQIDPTNGRNYGGKYGDIRAGRVGTAAEEMRTRIERGIGHNFPDVLNAPTDEVTALISSMRAGLVQGSPLQQLMSAAGSQIMMPQGTITNARDVTAFFGRPDVVEALRKSGMTTEEITYLRRQARVKFYSSMNADVTNLIDSIGGTKMGSMEFAQNLYVSLIYGGNESNAAMTMVRELRKQASVSPAAAEILSHMDSMAPGISTMPLYEVKRGARAAAERMGIPKSGRAYKAGVFSRATDLADMQAIKTSTLDLADDVHVNAHISNVPEFLSDDIFHMAVRNELAQDLRYGAPEARHEVQRAYNILKRLQGSELSLAMNPAMDKLNEYMRAGGTRRELLTATEGHEMPAYAMGFTDEHIEMLLDRSVMSSESLQRVQEFRRLARRNANVANAVDTGRQSAQVLSDMFKLDLKGMNRIFPNMTPELYGRLFSGSEFSLFGGRTDKDALANILEMEGRVLEISSNRATHRMELAHIDPIPIEELDGGPMRFRAHYRNLDTGHRQVMEYMWQPHERATVDDLIEAMGAVDVGGEEFYNAIVDRMIKSVTPKGSGPEARAALGNLMDLLYEGPKYRTHDKTVIVKNADIPDTKHYVYRRGDLIPPEVREASVRARMAENLRANLSALLPESGGGEFVTVAQQDMTPIITPLEEYYGRVGVPNMVSAQRAARGDALVQHVLGYHRGFGDTTERLNYLNQPLFELDERGGARVARKLSPLVEHPTSGMAVRMDTIAPELADDFDWFSRTVEQAMSESFTGSFKDMGLTLEDVARISQSLEGNNIKVTSEVLDHLNRMQSLEGAVTKSRRGQLLPPLSAGLEVRPNLAMLGAIETGDLSQAVIENAMRGKRGYWTMGELMASAVHGRAADPELAEIHARAVGQAIASHLQSMLGEESPVREAIAKAPARGESPLSILDSLKPVEHGPPTPSSALSREIIEHAKMQEARKAAEEFGPRMSRAGLKKLWQETPSIRYGAIGLGALATYGFIRSRRRKDHSADDVTVPGMPGGSPYTGYQPDLYGYEQGYLSGDFPKPPGGTTYQINALGDFDPHYLQGEIAKITGGMPISGNIESKQRYMTTQRPSIEERMRGG